MINNGYLKTADLEAALSAAAAVIVRKGSLGEALEAAASALRAPPATEHGAVRTEKQPGDTVIGSTCNHIWESMAATDTHRCTRCKEEHKPDCPATLPTPGLCECVMTSNTA